MHEIMWSTLFLWSFMIILIYEQTLSFNIVSAQKAIDNLSCDFNDDSVCDWILKTNNENNGETHYLYENVFNLTNNNNNDYYENNEQGLAQFINNNIIVYNVSYTVL